MDLTTLFLVYAAVLVVCSGALVITWRQNPDEVGARNWAVGSVLGAGGFLVFALTGKVPALVWINYLGTLCVVAGLLFYALGTRQFVTFEQQIPRWFVVVFVAGAALIAFGMVVTPYEKGSIVVVGSLLAASFGLDVVATLLRNPRGRTAPGYFLALFFGMLGVTAVVRSVMTLFDPGQDFYERPIEHVLMFVGAVGGAASAVGFSMLTTSRLLTERARHLQVIEAAVDDLRRQLEGLAQGDYGVRATQHGTSVPLDGLAALFNRTAEQVGAAFGEIDRQRSLLQATFESMVDGLILLDDTGTILRVNPSFAVMTGHAGLSLEGTPLAELVAQADRERVGEFLTSASESPVRAQPLHFIAATGESIRLTVNASSHCSEAGALLGLVLIVRDEREIEEARAQLQITDRMAAMGTVAAGVAHEINNPLAFVLGNLDFVLEELRSSEGDLAGETVADVVEALESAHRGGDRVRRLVKDLRTLTRPADESTTAVDVNALVESAAAMLDNEIRHHARLELGLGAVPPVEAGETRLAQVFLNLIHNAVQAIPPGEVQDNAITVTTGLDAGGRVVVEVTDSGDGIAPEHLERIFDAFYTTKPVGVGTGLGLSICHRVVSGLGGRIEVDSVVGQGTTFRVLLPAAAPSESAEDPSLSETPERVSSGHRVLVVDDELEVGQSIRRILGRAHAVEIATSPRDALALLRHADFDVILCDVMMPEMTGMQLHAEICDTDPDLARRMVFLSGGVFSPEAADFLRACENPVIHKPFHAKLLRRIVAEVGSTRAPARLRPPA